MPIPASCARGTTDVAAPGPASRLYLLCVACCFALPIGLRAYTFFYPLYYNLDETQWTVSARHILDDPILWRSNDLQTSGPLNALAIAWPFALGLIPSVLTSRLTGFLLQGGALAMVAMLARPAGFGPGVFAALLTALFLGLNTSLDYAHYASEDLSVFLICLFGLLFAGSRCRPGSTWRWFACGLIASCLPFAKLQSALLCILLHALCLASLVAARRRGAASWAQTAAYFAGGALPPLLLIGPLFLVGEQQAVITGYIGLGASYAGVRSWSILAPIIPFLLAASLLLAAVLVRCRSVSAWRQADPTLLLLGLGLWPVALLTVWFPGRLWDHYRLYAIFALPLSVALADRAIPRPGRRAGTLLACAVLGCAMLGLGASLPDWYRTAKWEVSKALAFAYWDPEGRARSLYDWTGVSPDDGLLMWGYESELAAYARLKPGDRAAMGEYLIRPTPGRDYFRARLLADLRRRLPALVIDAARHGYFMTNYAEYRPETAGLASFPALDALVQTQYERIDHNPDCAALYLRRDLVPALRASEIPLHSSAPPLVDGSITERCDDWWAPPAAPTPTAELTLDQAEPVRELWLLGSRGGLAHNRGTPHVRVSFTGPDGGHTVQDVHLFDYPKWTVIHGPDTPTARIGIALLDAIQSGPALNEVKAFRTLSKGSGNWLTALAGVQWQ